MPVDKFGRMSDTKTKDTGVSLTYINNNYVRSDGGTPLSGSLDMRGNTIYNSSGKMREPDLYAMPSRCPRSLRCFWGVKGYKMNHKKIFFLKMTKKKIS